MAAAKLRYLTAAGGSSHRKALGWRGNGHLLADLDAAATDAMTGGGYPNGIRQIVDPYLAGQRQKAVAPYARWLPPINYENRQCGLQACKIRRAALSVRKRYATPCKKSTRRPEPVFSKLRGRWIPSCSAEAINTSREFQACPDITKTSSVAIGSLAQV